MLASLLLGIISLGPPDYIFIRIQEKWVRDSVAVASLDDVLPATQAYLIRRLGDGHSDCRDVAESRLQAMGQGSLRAIGWGLLMKDPETVARSTRLYNTLFICESCHGDGLCKACKAGSNIQSPCPKGCNMYYDCTICKGTGDLRITKNFANDVVEVDFFPPRKPTR